MDMDEYICQQNELARLKTHHLSLIGDNMSLRNSIRLLLKTKCKRYSTITIDLYLCLQKYFSNIYLSVNEKEDVRPIDALIWMITKLLRGTNNDEVSCIVLDTNTVVYMDKSMSNEESMYVVTTIDQFVKQIQLWLSEKIIQSKQEMSELFTNCWVILLNDDRFESVVRKALSIYKQR
tara:strand:- start:10484 stop:11017 length:534 start_codon:yes stop_codon:yes gene_type:complete